MDKPREKKEKVEQALRESEEKYRTLFENMVQGAFYQQADGTFIDVNPAALKMLGLSRDQFLKRTSRSSRWHVIREDGSICPGEKRPSMIALKTGKPIRNVILGVFNPVRKDYIWMNISAIPRFRPGEKKPYQVFVTLHDITEHRKVTEKLQNTVNEWQSTFDSNTDAICLLDTKQRIIRANRAMLKLTRKKPSELIGKHCWEMTHHSDKPIQECPFQRMKKSLKRESMELSWGKSFFRITVDPILDGQGKLTGAVHGIRDITKYKRTEQTIQTSESRYRELFNHINSGVAVYEAVNNGKDFIFRDFNQAGQQIDKIKKKDLIGKSVLQVFPGIKELNLFDTFRRVWKTGKPEHHPVSFYKDERIIGWRENYVYKLPSGEIVAVYDDVTERKQAEQALRESEEKYRELINGMHDTAWVIDFNGKFIDVNNAAIKILGYSRKELLSMGPPDIDSSLNTKTIKNLIKGMKTDKLQVFETTHTTKNGKTIPVEIQSTLVTFQGKDAILSIARDITERKRAEEQLRLSEIALKKAQHVAHVGNWTWYVQENRLEWSDEMYRIFGIDKKEFSENLNEVIAMAIHPEDRTAVEASNLSVIKDKKPIPLEYRVVWPDGTVRTIWAEAGELILDDFGNPAVLTGIVQDITERKQAEDLLKQREDIIHSIVETSRDWIWAIDIDGKHTYCNPAIQDILGYKPDDLVGKPSINLLHKEDRKFIESQLPKWIAKNEGWKNLILRWKHRDGNWHWLESNAVPSLNANGKLTGFRGVDRDITERKTAEEALHESEARFRRIFEDSPIGMAVSDKSFRFVKANPSFCSMLGYTEKEILSLSFKEITHPDYIAQDIENIRKLASGQITIYKTEKRYIRKNGEILWGHLTLSKILDEKGKLVYYLVMLQNITERKQAGETISKERSLLRTLIDNLPCAVFVKDKEYRKIIVNPIHINRVQGHLKYLGINEDIDILGKTDFEIFPKELAERFFADDQKVIRNGKIIINHEEIGANPEGEKIWLLVSKVPLHDNDGSIIGMVGITTDITDRKLAEDQLQNDLREKEILLKELYHRTKNNMQVISSMLRLKARNIKNKEMTASFKEIESKILSMALAHQKLYDSKDLSHLNLKEYINDLVSLLKSSQLVSSGRIIFTTEGENINVLIDTAIPVGLIINELITNSLKYAFPDKRQGEIKIKLFTKEKNELVLEVSDNGVGLPKGFDIQKDSHLGIRLVIDLVEHQLQGKIKCESKKGLLWRILLNEELYKPRV